MKLGKYILIKTFITRAKRY